MPSMDTEKLFREIQVNDEFLSNYITNATERIRVSVELESHKTLRELLTAQKKGGKA